MKSFLSIAAIAAFGLAANSVFAGDLPGSILTNGTFETEGGSGPASALDWTYFVHDAQASVERSSVDPYAGEWDLHVVVLSSPSFGNAQSLNAVSPVAPNSDYNLGFFLLNNNKTGHTAFPNSGAVNAYVDFYTAGHSFIGRELLINLTGSPEDVYTLYTDKIVSPANAAFADVFLDVATGSNPSAETMDVRFDNVSLAPCAAGGDTPEPASLSVLAVGAAGLLLRRRK